MLYFAYGSNMNWQQMLERCPSACFIGIATLPNHKLAFTRKSDNRRCGVADAVFEQGQVLWGVVYEITAPDIEKLDSSEGYREGRNKNSYLRRECKVWLDGIGLQPLSVFIYFADRQPNPPLPSIDYKTLLLSGARHWHLPNEYVRGLEAIKVSG
jgi:cation transport regulator ChaC